MFNIIPVLPSLENPPNVTDISSNALQLHWTEWKQGVDDGDPPLTGYVVFTKTVLTNWTELSRVTNSTSFLKVDTLDPDYDYEFSVAAVREGPGGTGPRSPATNATTLCESES